MQETHNYDLAIIGGGINGVAAARDAALRGLKVILLERGDFASGASSKTSKLAHGGLRYLEHFEFGLVKESLHERDLLLKNAAHLIQPLPFLFPVYKKEGKPLWQVKLGLYLYDFLTSHSPLPLHQNMVKEDVCKEFPQLLSEKLSGGCLYYDALMRDSRIVIETALAAEKAGAHIYNYAPVIDLLYDQGKVCGLTFRREQDGSTHTIYAKVIANTTGAWSNEWIHLADPEANYQVKPSKGVHIVVPQIHPDKALILFTPKDRRVVFVIPWNDYSLIGTTDTPYSGDLASPDVTEEDIGYLLNVMAHYFPKLELSEKDVIASYAGLRPLIDQREAKKMSDISRTHEIFHAPSGVLTLLGGKYTTHRKMAEDLVDTVIKELPTDKEWKPCSTENRPLDGAREHPLSHASQTTWAACAERHGISLCQLQRLVRDYGANYHKILALLAARPSLKEQLCPYHPHLAAELIYAIEYEKAMTPEDWFQRRTSIAYTPCGGHHCADVTASFFRSKK